MVLSIEQYKTLNKNREAFETLKKHGFVIGLKQSWLKELKDVYKEVYNYPLSIACSACISAALNRLYPLIQQYERTESGA